MAEEEVAAAADNIPLVAAGMSDTFADSRHPSLAEQVALQQAQCRK